jgi:hypothetical protein
VSHADGWHFVELCCGSAAMTLHLLGATRALLPYQGSKWRFRKAIVEVFEAHGFAGPPASVGLYDPGPWGVVVPVVLDPARRASVIAGLEALAAEDPRAVYERLHGGPVADDPVAFAVAYLFLQRLAFSGKAVGIREGCWSSPGFNTSSAYGLPGTERFGAVQPMVPSLVRVLRTYGDKLRQVPVEGGRRPAPMPEGPVSRPTLVYLDPPYAGSTRYPNGDLDRDGVVALASAWSEAGARVVISEGVPIAPLGWPTVCLTRGRDDTSPFRGKQAEWLTVSPN